MTRPQIPVDRLVKLLPLLASDQDGEALSAARAIQRALAAAHCDFHDLCRHLEGAHAVHRLAPPVGHPLIDSLVELAADLTPWERDFVTSVRGQYAQRRRISEKQLEKLLEILSAHRVAA